MLGDTKRENRALRAQVVELEGLLHRAAEALAPLKQTLPEDVSENWLDDIAAWRRVVVDHIVTGLRHPDRAVHTQAVALQTELDAAGLNVDDDVRHGMASAP